MNPKDSVNTDGCNPESCHGVNIIGTYFSVGDDCVAIKSGKVDIAKKYYRNGVYVLPVTMQKDCSGGFFPILLKGCGFVGCGRQRGVCCGFF